MFEVKGSKNSIVYDIEIKNWRLLGGGEGHIVLQNIQKNDELFDRVLIICIHHKKPVPQEIINLYYGILSKIVPIQIYLLEMQQLQLQASFRQAIIEAISHRIIQSKELHQKMVVYIAQNLGKSKQKWTHYLEFKPKTPLPDQYTKIFLQPILTQHQISHQILSEYVFNRPFQERTRWFKKNSLKKSKKNYNPLQIFGIQSEKLPKIFQNAHQFSQNSNYFQLSEPKKDQINKKLIELIKQSGILEALLQLQLLYTDPNPDGKDQFYTLWQKLQDRQQFLHQASRYITEKISNCKQPSKIVKQLYNSYHFYENKQFSKINLNQQLIHQLCFLISWSWRDVSLFIRLRINPLSYQIEDIQIKIIDYQLKDTMKIISTIHKDRKYLENYLKYLRIIHQNNQ